MNENTQVITVKKEVIEPVLGNGNGNHALLPPKKLPVSKQISNQDLIAEEKLLVEKETEVEKNYRGVGGYLRLFRVSKVIGMLSLYLYL